MHQNHNTKEGKHFKKCTLKLKLVCNFFHPHRPAVQPLLSLSEEEKDLKEVTPDSLEPR